MAVDCVVRDTPYDDSEDGWEGRVNMERVTVVVKSLLVDLSLANEYHGVLRGRYLGIAIGNLLTKCCI